MALLISDGFSLYSDATSGNKIKNWSNSGGTFNFLQAGRWGTGSYSVSPSSSSTTIFQTSTVSGSTTIASFAFSTSSTSSRVINSITVNSTTVVLETISASGGFNLRVRNSTSSTIYFTSSTIYLASSYYYLELKIVWNVGGTGQIVLRVDNVVVYDSGATLTIVAANGSATITLGAGASTGTTGNFTDFLFMDGSGTTFNDFQGDVRIEALRASGDGANSSWSLPNNTLLTDANQSRITTSASGWASLSGSPTLSRTATGGPDLNRFASYLNVSSSTATFSIISSPNGTSGYTVTPGQILATSLWSACSSGVPTITVQARFYDSGGSQVGSDLSFGTLGVGPNTWAFQTPASTVTVPSSSATCALIISFTSNSQSYRFTGFVLSSNSTTPAYTDPTGAHYLESNEFSYDSDSSYVKSDVLNAKDSYAMSDMSANGQILGVRPVLVARKETAGPQRTIATMVRISGTDYTNSNNQVIPSSLTYTTFTDLLTTSPATSTTWTKTEVNNIEAGFNLTQ